MSGETFLYKAFISYRHVERDRVWARWLIEKLETFRVPAGLAERGIGARIGHIFRDDDEIPASSDLSHQIEEALKASEFLIVVCSPRTPHSRWVRREIEIFQQLGRGECILALLTEGEPEESFPPELLRVARERVGADGTKSIEWADIEPIAADVRPHPEERASVTKRRALLRIAASLLRCRFDDLAQRDRQRRMRAFALSAGSAAIALLAVSVLGYEYWHNTALQTRYYAQVGTRWGMPFGIGELSAGARARRADVYEIKSRAGQVVQLRHLNGYGALATASVGTTDDWEENGAVWKFTYEDGRVQKVSVFDPAMAPVVTERYEWDHDKAVVSFRKSAGRLMSFGAGDADIFSARPASGASQVSQHRLAFTPGGLVATRRFETPYGTPARQADGESEIAYNYDRNGRVLRVVLLDDKGAQLSTGASEELRTIDGAGNLTHIAFRDSAGNVRGSLTVKYDGDGNFVEVEIEGDSIARWSNMYGVARAEIQRDAHGAVTGLRFYNASGNLTWNDLGVAQVSAVVDEKGRVIRTTYLGLDGKPTLSRDGYAVLLSKYDERGNEIEEDDLGVDGALISSGGGCMGTRSRYDDDGNQTWTACTGPSGALLASLYGDAQQERRFNENGLVTEIRYEDRSGNLVIGGTVGCARQTYEYDERGNMTEERCYGPDGNLMRSSDGSAIHRVTYDDAGNILEQSNFGVDQRPGVGAYGFATLKQSYDRKGQITESTVFGADNGPMIGGGGYFRAAYDYDAYGDVVRTAFFDTQNHPAVLPGGASTVTARYDERGHQLEQTFYDVNGNRLSETIRRYAPDGSFTEEAIRFGPGGQVAMGPDGCAILDNRDNTRGWSTDMRCLGADETPKMSNYGTAETRYEYDARGYRVAAHYFDTNGKPVPWPGDGCATDRWRLDGRGNMIEFRCLDGAGRLLGITRVSYDNLNLETERAFFDAEGKPVTRGASRVETSYDAKRRPMESHYFDSLGHLLNVGAPVVSPAMPSPGAAPAPGAPQPNVPSGTAALARVPQGQAQ